MILPNGAGFYTMTRGQKMSAQYETLPEITDQSAGRWAQILSHCGVDDKYLSGNHTPCVLSGCGGKDRSRWDKTKEVMFCNQCGHKNPMSFLMDFLGMDYAGVAKHIRENILGVVKVDTKRPTGTDYEKNRARLDKIKSGCVKITEGDPVYRYLRKRGINILPDGAVMYHPAIDYWEDGKKTGTYPAMVACIMNNAMKRATYKITYLTPDGLKADVPCQKKLMPTEREISGACVRMFRFTDTLAVAEGIETALSFTQSTGISCWSADTAGNLQKFDIPNGVENLVIVSDGDFVGKQAAYSLAVRAARTVKVNVVYPLRINAGLEYVTDIGEKVDFNDLK